MKIDLSSDEEDNRVHKKEHPEKAIETVVPKKKRNSILLLGQEVLTDKALLWRVKWGQRGGGFFTVVALIFYLLIVDVVTRLLTIISGIIAIIFMCMLYYKNISFNIVKQVLKESNVVFMILLSTSVFIIDCLRPMTSMSPLMGFIYMTVTYMLVFLDALKMKSRIFLLIVGTLCIMLNCYNVYGETFLNWDMDIVLFNYVINGEKYTFMKRATKRSMYLQILLFSISGVKHIFKDRKMEFMIFINGHIYRTTGTASKVVKDKTFSMKLEKERSMSIGKGTESILDHATSSRKRMNSINSWAETKMNTIHIMGKKMMVDESLRRRVRWAQRGIGFFSLIGTFCYIGAGSSNVGMRIAAVIFGVFIIFFFGILYYKNLSYVIMKRLLQEINVIIIIVSSLSLWFIEIVRPINSMSPILAFMNLCLVMGWLFLDAIKVKSRIFVIAIVLIYILITFSSLVRSTFANWDIGVILFQYTIHGKEYTIMKRATKRSIFLQIILFSMSGVYTIFKDRKMEMLMFANGHIYRKTGTASGDGDQRESFIENFPRFNFTLNPLLEMEEGEDGFSSK